MLFLLAANQRKCRMIKCDPMAFTPSFRFRFGVGQWYCHIPRPYRNWAGCRRTWVGVAAAKSGIRGCPGVIHMPIPLTDPVPFSISVNLPRSAAAEHRHARPREKSGLFLSPFLRTEEPAGEKSEEIFRPTAIL